MKGKKEKVNGNVANSSEAFLGVIVTIQQIPDEGSSSPNPIILEVKQYKMCMQIAFNKTK